MPGTLSALSRSADELPAAARWRVGLGLAAYVGAF